MARKFRWYMPAVAIAVATLTAVPAQAAVVNERVPVYQGIGFFTGQQGTSLAHFGTSLVKSSTTLPDVEVYASNTPKVVVVVNKGMSPQNAVISVGSDVTRGTVHQKDGNTVSYAKPTNLGTLAVTGGQLTAPLPGPSGTQLALS